MFVISVQGKEIERVSNSLPASEEKVEWTAVESVNSFQTSQDKVDRITELVLSKRNRKSKASTHTHKKKYNENKT